MSDAWMPFQPAIDEPSNAWPLSNLSIVNTLLGTETCCSLPRVSVKRRSTNLTSLSLISLSTSAGLGMRNLLDEGRNYDALQNGGKATARTMPYPQNPETPWQAIIFTRRCARFTLVCTVYVRALPRNCQFG